MCRSATQTRISEMRNKNINKVIGEGFVGLQKEVGELRKQVAERDALLASKQAEIDALMVITATMKRLMVG